MIDKKMLPVFAAIFILIVVFLVLLQQQRNKITKLETELSELDTMYQAEKTKAEDSSKKLVALNATVQESESQIKLLTEENLKIKQDKLQALSDVSTIKSDFASKLITRDDELKNSKNKVRKMELYLKKVEAKNKELKVKVTNFEKNNSKVELGKIVVTPEVKPAVVEQKIPPVTSVVETKTENIVVENKEEKIAKSSVVENKTKITSGLEGKVTVVNKEYDFAVINLGDKDGIKPGDMFTVFHNNKPFGELKVEKVQESISAAAFINKEVKEKITVGDKVFQKV